MNEVIVVEQSAVIKYPLLTQISGQAREKIDALNIDRIEATDENLSLIKATRADLNKDYKELEDQRKRVKEVVLAEYNSFEAEYRRLITAVFQPANEQLKNLASEVDNRILTEKTERIKSYFKAKNTYDFISFADIGLNIIKSGSDKSYAAQIDAFIAKVENDLEAIKGVPNSDRVLAKYHIGKDLSGAIAAVNQEMEREAAISRQREEQAAKRAEAKPEVKAAEIPAPPPVTDIKVKPEGQCLQALLKIRGSNSDIERVKGFLKVTGIQYEISIY
ncbi:MAG: DUF1351 domain-containing protein [Helicobacteraceae bacterium]|jgi:hypothetical protein|nr:DUF1351 domain-containing protein [Helicobacteraceae bacterium]